MKTHRFEIGFYFGSKEDNHGNIHIDWPSIHRQAGIEQIRWIKAQDPTQCQLVLEQRPNDNFVRVVVEIYSDTLATLYGLMWAK